MSQKSADNKQKPARRGTGNWKSNGSNGGQYRPLWNNFITLVGLFLTAIGIVLLLTVGLFALITDNTTPYAAIGGYFLVPFILLFGILLTPLGILFKSWRLHRKDPNQPLAFRFPRVNLADPVQRRAAMVVVLGTFLLLPVVGFSGYKGYRYTESRAFCTEVCHSVMLPQNITHEHSAHAQVACVRCHIGDKESWCVKSKLSGIPQVLAVMRGSYPRPIPSVITDLRPTRETCVQCHWPEKAFGARLKKIVRFASDESNTRRQIDVLLKIGGYETTKETEGIHAHMARADQIEYVATDAELQDIPWVRYTDESDKLTVFRADGRPGSAPRPSGQLRQFDCMDCHNRPAHRFRSPQDAVDLYLTTGRIDPILPYIKREAVAALAKTYSDEETVETEIERDIIRFYRTGYADRWTQFEGSIRQAIAMVQEIRRNNFFPHMSAGWQVYPDNIGHMISPGCCRCHDGKHVSDGGERIRFSCVLCHTFVTPGDAEGAFDYAGSFEHSFGLEDAHAALRCDDCHDGGVSPLFTCTGCHDRKSEH